MSLRYALTLVISNTCRHLLRADLGKVPGHHPVVEGVEHAHEAEVHPGGGLHTEYDVQAEEGGHHGDVAEYSDTVTNFINQQEPLVNQPRCGSLDWFLQRPLGD